MTLIKNVLENPLFISMSMTILFWLAVYFIVYIISVQQGLRKDIVRNAYNFANRIKKISYKMKGSVGDGVQIDVKASFSDLKRIKHYGRKASTILQIYLLEEDENLDVKAAESRLRQISAECGDVARAYRVDPSTLSIEQEIDDVIRLSSEASTILKAVMKQRDENKLMQI